VPGLGELAIIVPMIGVLVLALYFIRRDRKNSKR
jgi:hypothetical protein